MEFPLWGGDLPRSTQRNAENDVARENRRDHKLSGKKVGLLINFNTEHLKVGISRLVNEF